MLKRKFVLLSLILAVVTMFSSTAFTANAYEIVDVEAVFNESYSEVCALQYEGGGYIDESNYLNYISSSGDGLTVVESVAVKDTLINAIDNFEIKYGELLNVYKKASAVKLGTFYNINDFSPTENGSVLLNNKKSLAASQIDDSESKSEIDAIVNNFESEILSGIENGLFSIKLKYVQTGSGDKYTASVTANSLIFSSDSSLVVTDVKNEILIKNTQIALTKNASVIDEGGVVKYLNVALTENGVLNQSSYESDKIKISIELNSIGVTVADGEVLQVAKYLKNQEVEIIAATVESGYITFEVSQFGKYAVIQKGYRIENASAFLAFFSEYGIAVGIVAVILLIIIIAISATIKRKKRREKKEFKEFKKHKKEKQKKSSKREKKNKKDKK